MFRSCLQRAARWCGVLIVSRRHIALPYLEHPPQTMFDQVLLHCFPTRQGLRFIQIGANDGQQADPLARYLAAGAWSGLMFEPLATNHAALTRHHGANPRLRIRRAAVDETAGRRVMYDLDRAAHPGLPSWAQGLGSFSRERLLAAVRDLGLTEQAIVSEEIACLAWSEVWRDFGPQRCDLLVLDTEGYDLVLLRAAGLAQHRPRIIHFEHACVDNADRLAFYRELADLGYEIATDGPDTTAWLQS
jgi:FkbM family methyltransferase